MPFGLTASISYINERTGNSEIESHFVEDGFIRYATDITFYDNINYAKITYIVWDPETYIYSIETRWVKDFRDKIYSIDYREVPDMETYMRGEK